MAKGQHTTEVTISVKVQAEIKELERSLTVPANFIAAARAFPEKVDQALALLDSPPEVLEQLAKADALKHFSKRIEIDTDTINCIQLGRLKIIDKLGGLLAPEKGGRGKQSAWSQAGLHFWQEELNQYRKVHQHGSLLEDYFSSLRNGDHIQEASLAGFLRFTVTERREATERDAATDRRRQAKVIREHSDMLKHVNRYRAILVGTAWYKGRSDHDWLEEMGDRPIGGLSDDAAILFMLTKGDAICGDRCRTLIGRWEFQRVQRYCILLDTESITGQPIEEVVIGVRGDVPWESFMPRSTVKCPKSGREELVWSWVKSWAGSLRLEYSGRKPDEFAELTDKDEANGVCWPLNGEPVPVLMD